MFKGNFAQFKAAMVNEAEACGGADHVFVVGSYYDFFYGALAPCVMETPEAFLKAAFYCPLTPSVG